MEYIFLGIAGKDTRQEKIIQSIVNIRQKLIKIGYNADEVDYMIETQSKDTNLAKLDWQSLKEIETAMEGQLKIAKQCLEVI